jgi:hypothetical protein
VFFLLEWAYLGFSALWHRVHLSSIKEGDAMLYTGIHQLASLLKGG